MMQNRGETMWQQPTAVLLAGAIQPSPLRRNLGVPLLSLPLGHGRVLLDAWFDVLIASDVISRVLVLVNSSQDADELRRIAPTANGLTVEIVPESAHWRGSAGLLRDAVERLGADAVVGIEAHRLPPRSLHPLTRRAIDEHLDAVVGVTEDTEEPAGVYYFSAEALGHAPPVGYLDLKEQFLPALQKAGVAVWPAVMQRGQYRIRDLAGYLSAVRAMLRDDRRDSAPWIAPTAEVSAGARIEGPCIVEPGARIERGAVVHQSVVMRNAVIRSGAIVSRAVIGRRAQVGRGARVIDKTVQ